MQGRISAVNHLHPQHIVSLVGLELPSSFRILQGHFPPTPQFCCNDLSLCPFCDVDSERMFLSRSTRHDISRMPLFRLQYTAIFREQVNFGFEMG